MTQYLFQDVFGRPCITWLGQNGQYTTVLNEYTNYRRWDASLRDGKNRPSNAFFEAKGEYVCRAAEKMKAEGAYFYSDDRSVRWYVLYAGGKMHPAHAELDSKMINVTLHFDAYEEVRFRMPILASDEYARILASRKAPP